MLSSKKTVTEYLKSLPEDRRVVMTAVRKVILDNLPEGYKEVMDGMICYVVPLNRYPAGYLGKKHTPLPYIGLASQKNHMSLYLINVYENKEIEEWFMAAFKATGKRLDLGKCCVRFRKIENLPLELISEVVASTSVQETIESYERGRHGKHSQK